MGRKLVVMNMMGGALEFRIISERISGVVILYHLMWFFLRRNCQDGLDACIMICECPRLVSLFRYRHARECRSQFECFPSITFLLFSSFSFLSQGIRLSLRMFDTALGVENPSTAAYLERSFWGSSDGYVATVVPTAYIVSRSNHY